VFKGPTSNRREGKGRGGEGKGRIREKRKEGKRRGVKGKGLLPDIYSFCGSNFLSITGVEDRIIQELT